MSDDEETREHDTLGADPTREMPRIGKPLPATLESWTPPQPGLRLDVEISPDTTRITVEFDNASAVYDADALGKLIETVFGIADK